MRHVNIWEIHLTPWTNILQISSPGQHYSNCKTDRWTLKNGIEEETTGEASEPRLQVTSQVRQPPRWRLASQDSWNYLKWLLTKVLLIPLWGWVSSASNQNDPEKWTPKADAREAAFAVLGQRVKSLAKVWSDAILTPECVWSWKMTMFS